MNKANTTQHLCVFVPLWQTVFCSYVLIVFLSCSFFGANRNLTPELKFGGTENSYDFPQNVEWINVNSPLTKNQLKGKIVILHFWKYSSINSIHSIEDLKKLEKKWKKELVIVGIHSPKFTAEKNLENLRQVVLRLGIEYPVISDINFTLWRLYGINSWPSFVLIDPLGKVVGIQAGEGILEGFDKILSGMFEEFNGLGLINPKSVYSEKNSKLANTNLFFPTKLLLNEDATELFIADSGHNRILRVDTKTNRIIDVIGNGKAGFEDGNFAVATFYNPQGLVLKDDKLYIADSNNHSIREINLKTKKVTTIAGTGKQATTFNVSGIGKNVSFNSPWDLIEYKNKLYITMRGSHQVWTLDLLNLEADVYAGSGSENLFDGKLEETSFAQPTGITKDEIKFYITDSEASAIRSIDFKSSKLVKTIIGKGLFEFGDFDHSYPQARLQYPMGITYNNGKLYVADSLNNKIKLIDPYEKTSTTLAGTGTVGKTNGKLNEASFFEPSGIAAFKNKIYVADTNNHLIRVIDLETQTVTNFEIQE